MAIIGLKLTGFFVAMLCIIIPAATNCLTLISWSRFAARESIRRVNHTSVFTIIFVEIIRNNIFVFWSAKETSKQLPQAIGSGDLDFHLAFFSFWKYMLFPSDDFGSFFFLNFHWSMCTIRNLRVFCSTVTCGRKYKIQYQIMVPVIFLDYRVITSFQLSHSR